jgi:sulfur-oxidizing protein SoxY
MMLSRREIATVLGAAALGVAVPRAWADDSDPWPDIRDALFAGRTIEDGGGLLTLDAPERAYDAAVVPIAIKALVPQTPERFIRTVSLIVDKNPAPLAVTFHLRPEAGRADLGARVRVNEYTNVRAVAETSDGRLWMVERFVKAAGGCSAPSSKDAAAAMARLGKMKLKPLGTFLAGEVVPVELLVSHPQYTGMQIDQVTRNWIPPDHLTKLAVRWNDRPLLDIDADISLSEDPALDFSLVPEGPGTLTVAIDDTESRHFEQSWPLGPGS